MDGCPCLILFLPITRYSPEIMRRGGGHARSLLSRLNIMFRMSLFTTLCDKQADTTSQAVLVCHQPRRSVLLLQEMRVIVCVSRV